MLKIFSRMRESYREVAEDVAFGSFKETLGNLHGEVQDLMPAPYKYRNVPYRNAMYNELTCKFGSDSIEDVRRKNKLECAIKGLREFLVSDFHKIAPRYQGALLPHALNFYGDDFLVQKNQKTGEFYFNSLTDELKLWALQKTKDPVFILSTPHGYPDGELETCFDRENGKIQDAILASLSLEQATAVLRTKPETAKQIRDVAIKLTEARAQMKKDCGCTDYVSANNAQKSMAS